MNTNMGSDWNISPCIFDWIKGSDNGFLYVKICLWGCSISFKVSSNFNKNILYFEILSRRLGDCTFIIFKHNFQNKCILQDDSKHVKIDRCKVHLCKMYVNQDVSQS